MELWYWHHSYLASPKALESSKALVDRAAAAGYTGLVLGDTSLIAITFPWWPQQNVGYLREFVRYASAKGLKVMPQVAPYGHSNDVLRLNPNWAEGQRVIGTHFQVVGERLEQVKSAIVPVGRREFAVTPWRQYHIHLLDAATGAIEVFDVDRRGVNLLDGRARPGIVDFTFNTRDAQRVKIAAPGRYTLEETALVYVIRRKGTPLRVYDGSTEYLEGVDFEPIRDAHLAKDTTFENDNWHAALPIRIPAGSRLKPGQEVAIDYYALQPVYNEEAGLCLADPDVLAWVADDARRLAEIFPADAGLFLAYDEMAHMNSCVTCRAKRMTPGQLLAWNVEETIRTLPKRQLYVWSDMFDPWHNARNRLQFVEGDISGSWRGLPPEVIIMNWNLVHLRASLIWFSGQKHRQVIAGFYDPADHDGERAARRELRQANGISGVIGMMYTTWADDYSQLESYARGARGQWEEYWSARPW